MAERAAHKALEPWIAATLREVSRGELQRRTHIPASVLKAAAEGRRQLGRASKLALYNVHRSQQFHSLITIAPDIPRQTALIIARSINRELVSAATQSAKARGNAGLDNMYRLMRAGMRPLEAAAHADTTAREAQALARKMDKYARLILENARRTRPGEKITLADIKAGLSRSTLLPTMQEVEQYVKPYARGKWKRQPTAAERHEVYTEKRREARGKGAAIQEQYIRELERRGAIYPPEEEESEE